ncbi:MAG TPA: MFS transporter [Candidatus Cybelea sp.]|nr:MFS transporter [Candidatus Cybelea sp.]
MKSPLRHPPFLIYLGARFFSEFSYQVAAVVIGWNIYALTHSAFDLGMAGLVQFIPTALLVFVTGSAADRFSRRRVMQVCQIVQGLVAAFLAWGSFEHRLTVPAIFAAVAVLGVADAFESPATSALLSAVTERGALPRGAALSSGGLQFATIAGPALGGLLYAVAPSAPYGLMFAFWAIAAILSGSIVVSKSAAAPPAVSRSFRDLWAGVDFVRKDPAILGTISLDLFAVLFGGATALLPIYARDILHVGPLGLGVLRAAPAAGALLLTVALARRSISRRAGPRMFGAVIVFGLATIVFAVSRSFWLSLCALAVLGAADTVSVVIRSSLVQLRTPDAMRGRVGAVNFLFINASNQLGAFESGTVAALLGAVPSALLGGVASVALAFLWMWLFPSLRTMEKLE